MSIFFILFSFFVLHDTLCAAHKFFYNAEGIVRVKSESTA